MAAEEEEEAGRSGLGEQAPGPEAVADEMEEFGGEEEEEEAEAEARSSRQALTPTDRVVHR